MHRQRLSRIVIVASALVAATLFASGCARTSPPVTLVAVALPPPALPRPERPSWLPATLNLPPLGADGAFVTINDRLSPAATIWHVRSALNVAALGCRGPEEAAIVADYNALLAAKRDTLARANTDYQAAFRAAGGDWQAEHDRRLTRVYNFLAQPLAPGRFCAEAEAVAREAAAVPDNAFADFARLALIRLEAPFTDAYRAYAGWQSQLAAWEAGASPPPPTLAYASFDMVMAWAPSPPARPVQQASLR